MRCVCKNCGRFFRLAFVSHVGLVEKIVLLFSGHFLSLDGVGSCFLSGVKVLVLLGVALNVKSNLYNDLLN